MTRSSRRERAHRHIGGKPVDGIRPASAHGRVDDGKESVCVHERAALVQASFADFAKARPEGSTKTELGALRLMGLAQKFDPNPMGMAPEHETITLGLFLGACGRLRHFN